MASNPVLNRQEFLLQFTRKRKVKIPSIYEYAPPHKKRDANFTFHLFWQQSKNLTIYSIGKGNRDSYDAAGNAIKVTTSNEGVLQYLTKLNVHLRFNPEMDIIPK